MFVLWQAVYIVIFTPPPGPPRWVDIVMTVALVSWCVALLTLLATGGGAFRRPEVREVLDDELARAQRALAYRNAFHAVMIVGLAAFVVSQFTAIDARHLAHVMVSTGVLVTIATQAFLNRR